MDKLSLQKIQDVVAKSASMAIVVGKDPTLDQMAAALGLYLSLTAEGKKAAVACPTDPIVAISSLVGIDKVKNRLEGKGGDLVVSFPYRDGEIEKVSYTIENNFLNIVVKAGERGLTFDEKDVQYSRGGGAVELLFIIGTPKLSDLGGLFNPDTLKDTTIVNIDNKAENQGFGELVVVSPNASSVSEMIAELVVELGYQLDVDVSQNLLSGILDATGNFQDSKTSSLAFEMAGLLMKNGAIRMPASTARQQDRDAFAPFVQQQSGRMSQPFPQVRQGKVPTRPFPQQFSGVSDDRQMPPPDRADRQDRQIEQKQPADQKPPADWLTPKVYKGSSEI